MDLKKYKTGPISMQPSCLLDNSAHSASTNISCYRKWIMDFSVKE